MICEQSRAKYSYQFQWKCTYHGRFGHVTLLTNYMVETLTSRLMRNIRNPQDVFTDENL